MHRATTICAKALIRLTNILARTRGHYHRERCRPGILALALLALAFLLGVQRPAEAQQIVLESDIILCREARLTARRSLHLQGYLVQMGMPPAAATAYVIGFIASTDQCEMNPNHTLSPPPTFPQTTFDPQLGLYAFLEQLAGYGEELASKCRAGFTLARIAPTKQVFDSLIDRGAFGNCSSSGGQAEPPTGGGQLPLAPSLNSQVKQCLVAVGNLARDPCPDNPRGEGSVSGGTKFQIPQEWFDQRTPTKTSETLPNGGSRDTLIYTGILDGSTVRVEIVVTEHMGTTSIHTSVETVDHASGTKTVETRTETDGKIVAEGLKITDHAGGLILDTDTAGGKTKTVVGDAHPKTKEETEKELDRAQKWTEILNNITSAIGNIGGLIPSKKECVRFPGATPRPAYYKDEFGQELDLRGMIEDCMCAEKAARCPSCPVSETCQSEADKQRRECLKNPLGPTDEPRPECLALLKQDNQSINLDAEICSNVKCTNDVGTVLATIGKGGHLSCGCFGPPANLGGNVGGAGIRGCEVMLCESGTCGCQNTAGGARVCGCVAPTGGSGGGGGNPVPTRLGLPGRMTPRIPDRVIPQFPRKPEVPSGPSGPIPGEPVPGGPTPGGPAPGGPGIPP